MTINPSIAQLRYLLAVERTGHFHRAAEACGVSQPTLSAQIQKAETALGVQIFDRSQKPVRPTAAGADLLRHAQAVVQAHDALLHSVETDANPLRGPYRLGAIPTLAPYVVPGFLQPFSADCPAVDLTLREQPTDALVDGLQRRTLDAALLATPLDVAGLETTVLFYDPFYLYAHPDEAALRRTTVRARQLAPDRLWLLEDGHCLRRQVVQFCGVGRRASHLGRVRFDAGSLETIRALVDRTGGYTLIPESFARTLPRSVRTERVRPFTAPMPVREVSLVTLRRPGKAQIRDALAKVIRASLPRSLRNAAPDGEILPVARAGHPPA